MHICTYARTLGWLADYLAEWMDVRICMCRWCLDKIQNSDSWNFCLSDR